MKFKTTKQAEAKMQIGYINAAAPEGNFRGILLLNSIAAPKTSSRQADAQGGSDFCLG
jgi:hypothetical protein